MMSDFILAPMQQTFDVGAIDLKLATMPYVVRDEVTPNEYLAFDDDRAARAGLVERRRDPKRFPYSAALIIVTPSRIHLGHRGSGIATLRAFVDWLAAQTPVRYLDEAFREIEESDLFA